MNNNNDNNNNKGDRFMGNYKSGYDNFIFYGSWRETLEGFEEDFGEEYAYEALWNLMLCATAGDIKTNKKSIIKWINGSCVNNINSAKDRYARAVENGKKGGRPIEVDSEQITELKAEGLTNDQIANKLGCSTKTVQRALKKVDKTGQNLDIDIDNEIDIENDKEKDVDKENEIETYNSIYHNLDLISLIIKLFKNKNKYVDIQAKVKEQFRIDIQYDEIKNIIDNREQYEDDIEKDKRRREKAAKKEKERQYQYRAIPDVIDILAAKGINTTYDEIKTAYDEIDDSNIAFKWSIYDLKNDDSLYLIKPNMTFCEYANAVQRQKENIFGWTCP